MDDQLAAAILGKLKAGVAGAILNEMEADRASKLATLLSATTDAGKKS
jgi:flagellar motility protein MotE (MotC chaperone)